METYAVLLDDVWRVKRPLAKNPSRSMRWLRVLSIGTGTRLLGKTATLLYSVVSCDGSVGLEADCWSIRFLNA